jgi:hypothetical protein
LEGKLPHGATPQFFFLSELGDFVNSQKNRKENEE